jgi:hypothetical protein
MNDVETQLCPRIFGAPYFLLDIRVLFLMLRVGWLKFSTVSGLLGVSVLYFVVYLCGVHPVALLTDTIIIITPWSESASELYRPSDRRLSAK